MKARQILKIVDGDTISWHPLHSDEANQECNDYNNQPKSFVLPSGQTTSGVDDLCKITMRAMTRDVPELHQK